MQELDTLEEVMAERKLSKEVSKTAEFVTGAAPRLPKVNMTMYVDLTPGETENEWQKTDPVPILLFSGARSFFDAKKMKIFFLLTWTSEIISIYPISNPDGQDQEV